MKVKIKDKAFKGLVVFNGQNATLEIDKKTNEPYVGVSGKTKRFKVGNGGSIFLSEDQYEAA